jgi:superfamily I DNA and/or RNA helicase
VCTLATAPLLDLDGKEDLRFDWLLSDESAQATQPQLALAATLLRKATSARIGGQLLLCGDPYQLRPVLSGGLAGESGLSTSLMEQLLRTCALYQPDSKGERNPALVTQLRRQYRSVPALIDVPNRCFYQGRLEPTRSAIAGSVPLQWIAVEGSDRQEKGGTSRYNDEEITAIIEVLRARLGRGFAASSIGIISPYACQNDRLKTALRECEIEGVEVGSVDMWQGREKGIILYSAVRHDPIDWKFEREGTLGHTADPHRFCVAITRAKNELIIFGSPHTLATDCNWARVLRKCITANSLRPAVADPNFDTTEADLDRRIRVRWGF